MQFHSVISKPKQLRPAPSAALPALLLGLQLPFTQWAKLSAVNEAARENHI